MLIDYKMKILLHTLATEAEVAFDSLFRIYQWCCFHVEGLPTCLTNTFSSCIYCFVVQR